VSLNRRCVRGRPVARPLTVSFTWWAGV
jgi:hypothetical protein